MKVVTLQQAETVHFSVEGFTSHRFLTASDSLGFTICKTVIPKGLCQVWHYTNHLEACYCVSGKAIVENIATGEVFTISPDVVYALDAHDRHKFTAITDVVLISVFNPPLVGTETHKEDGSYGIS